jgi:hypothetical protein
VLALEILIAHDRVVDQDLVMWHVHADALAVADVLRVDDAVCVGVEDVDGARAIGAPRERLAAAEVMRSARDGRRTSE